MNKKNLRESVNKKSAAFTGAIEGTIDRGGQCLVYESKGKSNLLVRVGGLLLKHHPWLKNTIGEYGNFTSVESDTLAIYGPQGTISEGCDEVREIIKEMDALRKEDQKWTWSCIKETVVGPIKWVFQNFREIIEVAKAFEAANNDIKRENARAQHERELERFDFQIEVEKRIKELHKLRHENEEHDCSSFRSEEE